MESGIKVKFNVINLLPLLVLCLCLGTTRHLWDLAYQLAKKEQQQKFDVRANEIEILIKQRLQTYAQVLHGGRGLFIASETVSRNEFKNYVAELQIEKFYPGIQGVGLSVLIPAAEKAKHLAAIRGEGFPNYQIWPEGERAFYSSVIYLEPFTQRNLRAFGYDMYTETVLRTAMDKAWQENAIALSGKVRLVQEINLSGQAGFLMYLPLYRKNSDLSNPASRRANLLGWIHAPFRMNDFMQAVLSKKHDITLDVDVDIYDGMQISPDTLLYNRENDDLSDLNAIFATVKYIEFAGHPWGLHIHSHPDFEAQIDLRRSYLTAASGAAITIMLTTIIWLLVNARKRVFVLAQKMNAELLEKETRYQQMFEGSSSISVLVDPENGNIINANLAASSFWRYSIEQLRTMNLSEINRLPVNTLLPILRSILRKSQHFYAQHRLSSGQIKDVEVYANAIVYQGRMVIHAIVHDITQRRRQEQEIKRLSDSELNKAKLEAERANRAKSEFLSSMSHELRTPMNAVLGFAQLLDSEDLNEDQHDSVKEILAAGHHLLDLINDVLDLSKIESDKLELRIERIDLNVFVQHCITLVQPLAIKNQIKIVDNISSSSRFTIMADSLRLKQVLLNLLSNAIKYNQTGGSLILSYSVIESILRINVTDTGKGLSELQLSKLFQPFERLSAKNSNIEGTGIGLCISKKLIEAMNGSIGVNSTVGEGSCFWVEIPLA